MKSPLRILHLEDDANDAEIILDTLKCGGITCETTRVQNRDEFEAALQRGGIDLILSDISLPKFDGMAAMAIARAKWPSIPFIVVSGSLGEELAIDSLKNGATDYVLKERVARLAPAVLRAMQDVEKKVENQRMEEALGDSEQRLKTIFGQSPLGIAMVGVDGRPVLTNPALEKMLGYTGEELTRMPFVEFTHLEDRAKDIDLYQQLLGGARQGYQVEKRYLRKDGQVVWARLSVSLARESAHHANFAIAMVEDMTERRELEAQFIEAQKMEVIGQLASGVAHDFNNLLAVIMGYSDLMLGETGLGKKAQSQLETIRAAAERAAGLTRQLLIFSRKQKVELIVLDLRDVVKELNKMLKRLVDENIKVTIIPGEQSGHIKADSGYIGQVLMNLVVNARDAMPKGGQLTIATKNVTLDESYIRKHKGAIAGEYVLLSVTDTGTGISEEVKAHLFEAFFTTKPKGKGTGLGLATCQTIVEQSGGHIEVCSEVGRGTTFNIYFPRVEQPLDVQAEDDQARPSPRGTEALLVVEDDPSLRHLATHVLAAQGYLVLSAQNGQEALRLMIDHKSSAIRLVITDVVMPLMGGKEMAEWLKTTNPNLKILFTSGHTDEVLTRDGILPEEIAFLPKPYTPATLARKVREMLDAK